MKRPFLAVLLVLGALAGLRADDTFTPIDTADCDVVVVGAGTAGVCAAVQAARAGMETILIESGFQPGGNATTGGVHFPGCFHAWQKQIIAGIGWEWVLGAIDLGGGTLPDPMLVPGKQHWRHQIALNGAAYSAFGEELCLKAGVRLRYFESPYKVEAVPEDSDLAGEHEGARWRMVSISQGEPREIFCRCLIDCTGNGRLSYLAGARLDHEEATQPGSLLYRINTGIDPDKIDMELVKKRFDEAVASGRLLKEDAQYGIEGFIRQPVNSYVAAADSSTGQTRTDTDIRGRQAMLRMLRFVRTLPRGENATIAEMSAETGVRESYRVHCLYTITADDYTAGKVWDDSLAYGFYPIDLHRLGRWIDQRHLDEGVVPTIPLRALIPEGVDYLLVAGRCLGSDRLANSGLRVQATCMATGQAAGAAAAEAIRQKVSPAQVDVEKVKALLREHGAIVP